MTNTRDKILQRILNLRARAADDGSSEAEADAAARKAADLMESYAVAEAELAIAESEGRIVVEVISKSTSSRVTAKHQHRAISTATTIADLTSTQVVSLKRTGSVEFTGHRPDVETAVYLFDVIRTALDREYETYARRMGPGVGRGAKASFQLGMVSRICQRLRQMKNEMDRKREEAAAAVKVATPALTASKSTELLIVDFHEQKRVETDKVFAQKYPKLGKSYTQRQANNGSAYSAGREAGGRVGLGKGVGSGSKGLLT